VSDPRAWLSWCAALASFAAGCGAERLPPSPPPVAASNVEVVTPAGWGARRLRLDDARVYLALSSEGIVAREKRCAGGSACNVLIAATEGAGELEIDAAYVYWSSNGIHRAPKAGGGAVTIAEGRVIDFVVDEAHVYWHDQQTIFRARKDGGPREALASGVGRIEALQVRAGYLYFSVNVVVGTETSTFKLRERVSEILDGAVMRMKRTGGAPERVAHVPGGAGAFEVNEMGVAWRRDLGEVWARGRDDREEEGRRFGGSGIFALDGPWLYFASGNDVHRACLGRGGEGVLVARGPRPIANMAVDGEHVYWTTYATGEGYDAPELLRTRKPRDERACPP